MDANDQPRDEDGKFAGTGGAGKSGENQPSMSAEEKRSAVKNALRKIADGSQEVTISKLRDDLEQYGGTNDVTLVRGDKNKGLEHIAARHGAEVIPGVLDAMVDGDVRKFVETKKTLFIDKNGYEAVLSLDEHGKKKTWLLTGYDIIPDAHDSMGNLSGESGKVSTRHAPTQPKPILGRPGQGADSSLTEIIAKMFKKPNEDGEAFAFDSASARTRDKNGFLHVAVCNITKETVNPYHGREIPGWRDLGLLSEKIYQGYRSGEELQKSIPTWRGLPLMFDHHIDSAENPQKDARVGAVGTDVAWSEPYLTASLSVWDADAQQEIETGAFRELSCAYTYTADFTPGEFEGRRYDFVMRNIKGNHVALVPEGRAGPDVVVADSQIARSQAGFSFNEKEKQMEILAALKSLISAAESEGPENKAGPATAGDADVNTGKPSPAPAASTENKGDDLDKIGAELFALIDNVQDKELAAQIKAKIGEIRGGIETVKKEESQSGTNAPAATDEDINGGKKEEQAGTGGSPTATAPAPNPEEGKALDAALKKFALDSARVKESAKVEAQAHFRSLYEAARRVRPLVGELDAMAFDSAGDIYRHALKASGQTVKTTDTDALAEMVGIALDSKRNAAAPVSYAGTPSQDGGIASILGVKTSI